jgi:hypothetical protein
MKHLLMSFYLLKQYQRAIDAYDSYINTINLPLSVKDCYDYAEAQAVLKNYAVALRYYRSVLEMEPENLIAAQKVWRLNNIQYLFEDSTHYAIWPLQVNTRAGEMCPVAFGQELIFLSNRARNTMQDNKDKKLNLSFYERYRVKLKTDTLSGTKTTKGKAGLFTIGSRSRFNSGPLAAYDSGKKVVYIETVNEVTETGDRTLGIFFAAKQQNKWKTVSGFAFNSSTYSIFDATINEDGTELFFTSDMKGGKGGKDIYHSELINGQWSRPENAGDIINTPHNESFPSWHKGGILFFSSDGHPGLGGLDIFRVPLTPNGYGEPQNLGFPINSSHDDFAISFDMATHGYLTSNRKNGGFDDDIYEFDMDLQTYPLTITGVILYKEHSWSDKSDIKSWPNVRVALIDSQSGKSVFESTTGKDGEFSLTIPYFSRYFIKIIDQEGKPHKASLELQKYKTESYVHEIVVIKDFY